MDCTLRFRMFQWSTAIDDGGGCRRGVSVAGSDGSGSSNNNKNSNSHNNRVAHSTRIQLHKRVKNIRLTHGQLQQPSRCKARLVLLLLGLWMNLIATTNGEWNYIVYK